MRNLIFVTLIAFTTFLLSSCGKGPATVSNQDDTYIIEDVFENEDYVNNSYIIPIPPGISADKAGFQLLISPTADKTIWYVAYDYAETLNIKIRLRYNTVENQIEVTSEYGSLGSNFLNKPYRVILFNAD